MTLKNGWLKGAWCVMAVCLLGAVSVAAGVPVTNGLVLWLDANDLDGNGVAEGLSEGGLNGNYVTEWVNKADNLRNAVQNTAGLQPVLQLNTLSGKPAVWFDGSDDFMTTPAFAATLTHPFRVYVVSMAINGDQQYIFDSLSASPRAAVILNSDRYNIFAGSNISWIPPLSFGQPMLATFLFNSTASLFRVNGLPGGQGNSGDGALDGLTIGGRYDLWLGSRESLDGYICEILVYSGTLTVDEGLTVENYLYNKWLSPARASIPMDDLRLWLRADAVQVDDGQVVGTWYDDSGAYRYARAVTVAPSLAATALNGKPAVWFNDAASLFGSLGGAVSNPLTIFAVTSFADATQPVGNYDYVMSIGDAVTLASIARWPTDNRYYYYNGANVYYGPALPGQQAMILEAMHDTTAPRHNLWTNGVPVTVEDYPGVLSLNGNFSVGASFNGTNPLNGHVGELLVWTRQLSEIERQQVGSYLADKWAIPSGYFLPSTTQTMFIMR